jgi:hypothetical protein
LRLDGAIAVAQNELVLMNLRRSFFERLAFRPGVAGHLPARSTPLFH